MPLMEEKEPYLKPKRKALQAPCCYTHIRPLLHNSLQIASLQAVLVAWKLDLAKDQAENISLSVSRAISLQRLSALGQ